MFYVYQGNNIATFALLEVAIAFAKISMMWYYITNETEVIYTQDDEILEGFNES